MHCRRLSHRNINADKSTHPRNDDHKSTSGRSAGRFMRQAVSLCVKFDVYNTLGDLTLISMPRMTE